MPKYLPFFAFLFLGGILLSNTVVSAQDTGRWTTGAPRAESITATAGKAIGTLILWQIPMSMR